MIKHFCDRCKKEIPDNESLQQINLVTGQHYGSSPQSGLHIYVGEGEDRRSVQLYSMWCEDCIDMFELHLEEKLAEGEEQKTEAEMLEEAIRAFIWMVLNEEGVLNA